MDTARYCLLLTAALSVLAVPCAEDNIDAVFTECYVSQNGTELAQVIQYWKEPCEQTGVVTLDPPKTVPCNVHCANGQFYSTDAVCEDCPAGTYSISETTTYSNFNNSLPQQMATYCHSYGCSTWNVQNGVLTSGDNSNSPDVESHLIFMAEFPNPATVTIQYRIESDSNTASLQLYLDDAHQMGTITGLDFSWDTLRINVWSPGTHIIRFTYLKNKASTIGADRAFIKSISIDRQKKSITACTTCPIGYVAKQPGSSACEVCPAGFKRDITDPATDCVKCADNEASAPGSASCYPLEECQFPEYGPCELHDGSYKRKATWSGQSGCISTKPESYEDCSECLEGYYRDSATGQCTHCPRGQYRNGDSCDSCSDGYVAHPKLLFSSFDTVEGVSLSRGLTQDDQLINVTNKCTGDCREKDEYGDDGWEIKRNVVNGNNIVALSSGKQQGNRVSVTLEISFKTVVNGLVDFQYYFGGATSCSQGYFYVNDHQFVLDLGKDELADDPIGKFSELEGSENIEFLQGQQYTIKWTFEKNCYGGDHISTLFVTEIVLHGVEGGAATSCVECPKGHKCQSSDPVPVACPKGTYQPDEQQSSCLQCPEGAVTNMEAQTECRVCAPAVASPDQSSCVATCKPVDAESGLSYDLTPIGNLLFGPIVDKDHIIYKQVYENFPKDADIKNQTLDDEFGLQRYFMKLCEIVNDENDEIQLCPSEKRAYACQRLNAELAYSMGDFPKYDVSPLGMNITITGGSPCYFKNGVKVAAFPRKSNIALVCDPEVVTMTPTMQFDREDACDYFFTMKTAYACPLCRDGDFFSVTSACDVVTQEATVEWHKNAGVLCLGSKAATTKSCKPSCTEADWEKGWGECTAEGMQQEIWRLKVNVSCLDDHDTQPSSSGNTRSCIGSNKMVLAVIIFLCVVILLIMVLCLTYRKKKMMETKYSRLAAQERDVPMSSFPQVDGTVALEDGEEDYETHTVS
eukprot:TRINITY_DN38079_c0_g1_i1.p1 TRINITY_DN38079_c0_g1~~TRINITY_DN38079_c0_g1_i1.p1  ORF type:complete len:974 (+),score=299.75 TRINITY_DN38079_c0_g1_i1:38-2959(+)